MAPPPNPLLNPGQPLQGQGLQQAATALTNAQTSGPLAELARQIANNKQQAAQAQQKTAGYFNQLGTYVKLGNAAETGIANDLNSQLSGIAQNTRDQIGQSGFRAAASPGIQGLAGTGLDGGGLNNIVQETNRQQDLASNNAGVYRSFGATQGANYRGLAASNAGTFGLKGQEALTGIARAGQLANEPINAKIADLHAQRGALLASNEGKLRQQEINNSITAQGLGIRRAALGATVQNNLANQSLRQAAINTTLRGQDLAQMRSDRQFQLDSQKFGAATAKNNYLKSHGLGPYKPPKTAGGGVSYTSTGQRVLPPVQQERLFGQIGTLQQLIRDGQAHGQSEQQIRAFLANGKNPRKSAFNPALIDAAYALNGYGYLTNTQVSELNKIGLVVGNRYKRGSAPAPNKGVLGGNLFGLTV